MFAVAVCLSLAVPSLPPESPHASAPVVTRTRDGRPGDPVNLRLVGTRDELVRGFRAAGWAVADPITARSALRIGVSVAFDRPYPAAPVSDLYLFGRVQDVAFERAVGGSARARHHVRFWQAGCGPDGRPVWVGAGTFDARVGRSPATGRLTHRISPDIDAERDTILSDLTRAGALASGRVEAGAGPFVGRNGECDCYHTDGGIGAGELTGYPCGTVCETAPGCRGRRERRADRR